jgi:hypothetical protein
LDPKWQRHFDVVFNFGQTVHLRFDVIDTNAEGSFENIGYYETTLTELIKIKDTGKPFTLLSEDHKDPGHLLIAAKERRSAT